MSFRVFVFCFVSLFVTCQAVSFATEDGRPLPGTTEQFLGTWWLEFADGYGGWLDVREGAKGLEAELLWRVGSPRSCSATVEGETLVLKRRRGGGAQRFVARRSGEGIVVELQQPVDQADGASAIGRGARCPPMPPRPDLSKVRFGDEIVLFNGRDLSGWRLQPTDAENGWSARDGELVNETPKTDFGAYGTYGNLRTVETFEDFRLHVEFNVEPKRNSGVYLRGLYEVQVVDRDSPMQGINGPGAIFGRVAPSKNAGKPGGQWQTYDLTLVDRHVTVVLNGEKVIDNEPVRGCTGGALFGDVTRPGPIYLQGDHTSVRYRNLRLRPRIE